MGSVSLDGHRSLVHKAENLIHDSSLFPSAGHDCSVGNTGVAEGGGGHGAGGRLGAHKEQLWASCTGSFNTEIENITKSLIHGLSKKL